MVFARCTRIKIQELYEHNHVYTDDYGALGISNNTRTFGHT